VWSILSVGTLLLLLVMGLGAEGPVQTPAQSRPASKTASSPATRPNGPTAFQPGVTIDWNAPAVRVSGRVVLRAGPLEFLACFPGKEHESIVLLEASAVHVYMALGLIGVSPGQPATWDEGRGVFRRPVGDLVDVSLEWGPANRLQTVEANRWLREIEYARPPLSRPWVFAGSQRLSDGTLAADRSGAGVALVSFSDSLLALSGGHSSRDVELWIAANTDAIPPEGTAVRLVLRPARPRPRRLQLDFRGAASVNGRHVTREDLADLLWLGRQLEPESVQTIHVQGTLQSDVTRLEQTLRARGVPADAFRFVRSPNASESTR
jgi:hypothetical protein